jgi:hypothetical protein
MADKEISALTAVGTPLDGTELVHVVEGGNSRKATTQDIADLATPPAGYEAGPPTPPVVANFAWVNQGTATATDGTGALVFVNDNDNEVHILDQAAPATPYDVYCRAEAFMLSSSAVTVQIDTSYGIILRDGVNGDFLECCINAARVSGDEQNTYSMVINRWTNATTYSATPLQRFSSLPFKWVRINNNGTTITLYTSVDGKNWTSVGTETIATFVGSITRIGLSVRGLSGNTNTIANFSYFSTTAPS